MNDVFRKLKKSIKHIEILHQLFKNRRNFSQQEDYDKQIYFENSKKFRKTAKELNLEKQLYGEKDRQMILADLIEYIFFGRGYYSMQNREKKQIFIKLILHLVNMLMSYEAITVSDNLRRKFLRKLSKRIPEVLDENYFNNLLKHSGTVGLPDKKSDAPKHLNRYFDSILPKTAGGLWHELLVFIFLLRNNVGYIIPLLLSQRLIGLERNIVPPDFLVITHNKNLYGVEVGRKKEIQSGSFSLQTSIPTATVDTINSRSSDRCPICHRWIPFCDFVIDKYSDFDAKILKHEVRCLTIGCTIYSEADIVAGACPYTKYYRKWKKRLPYTQHKFANKRHYHYKCILDSVSQKTRKRIIQAKDSVALKTHYPYYAGLEELI